MSLPALNGTARLIDDPELRYSAAGKAVAKIRLAFNSRKKNDAGEWVDADSFFIDGKVFGQTAENIAESLARGMEVTVSGRLRTEKWENQQGEKRSAPALLIDSIGPTLTYATAKVEKNPAGGQRQAGVTPGQGNVTPDPWANARPANGQQQGGGWGGGQQQPAAQGAGYSDQPPF
jgi:single-strand DNA-binding protein